MMTTAQYDRSGRQGGRWDRADAYDRYLATLRRKLATYQGGYLQAARREAEEIHCKWLLANQDAFIEEMASQAAGR
jgi:hypothetical protein